MYHKMEELPICHCGCGSRAHIDIDHLDQYSTDLLTAMLREINHVLEPYQGILGCSAPTCDEDAWNSWYATRDALLSQYAEPCQKITEELRKRNAPHDIVEFAYALGKLFQSAIGRENQKEDEHE